MLRAASAQRLLANALGYTALLNRAAQPLADRWCLSFCGLTPQTPPTRTFSSETGYDHEVDLINEKFAEAREEIEFAREDAETVYFNESAEVARKAVGDVLEQWQSLLGRVAADEQAKLQRSMGLKIQQLKAELKELDEMHA